MIGLLINCVIAYLIFCVVIAALHVINDIMFSKPDEHDLRMKEFYREANARFEKKQAEYKKRMSDPAYVAQLEKKHIEYLAKQKAAYPEWHKTYYESK